MNKRPRHDHFFSPPVLSFIGFWGFISSAVGSHRLDINVHAKKPQQLFNKNAVHPEHLKQLVLNSLANNSGKLTQAINLTDLLDDLGETAYRLRKSSTDDLFDIELLEEIAWHISERFLYLVNMPTTCADKDANLNTTSVVSLAKFKITRANRRA